MRKFLLPILIFSVLFISGCTSGNSTQTVKAVVYKSISCGCCVNYIPYLKQNGFEIETISVQDMSPIKIQYNIPRNMESCHTVIIGDYFIEGHVPIEAINKLLSEKPDIDGISLPAMPAGSPGMPGIKGERFKIYAIINGEVLEFMEV